MIGDEVWDSGHQNVQVTRVARLLEVSLVTEPAYESTNVGMALAEARSRGESPAATRRRVERALGVSGITSVREPEPYGPGIPWSWFEDRALISEMERRYAADRRHESRATAPVTGSVFGWSKGDARKRLDQTGREKRAITTGLRFVPVDGPPVYVGEAFATAARAVSVAARLFDVQEFPSVGSNAASPEIKVPRLSGAATVGVQATENTGPSNTDPTSAYATSPTATIAGTLVSSRQAWELGEGSQLDAAIAAELGRAWATALDQQLISGTGSIGQTLGLLAVSGVTAGTYTDATPTASKIQTALAQLASLTATARGVMPMVSIMHTRRWAFVAAGLDSQNRPLVAPMLEELDSEQLSPQGPAGTLAPGLSVYTTPTIPTNLGGGTEDRVILVNPADLLAFVMPPRFIVAAEASAELPNGQLRITAYGYLGAVPHRWPMGIGVLSGTGIAANAGW